MQNLWAVVIVMVAPSPQQPTDGSYEVMRLLLSHADLVVVSEIEVVQNGIGREANTHTMWNCDVRVEEVLKGKPPQAIRIRAGIDILTGHPFTPKAGDKYVLFLREAATRDGLDYVTRDIRFGVQPAVMAADLKQLGEEMRREYIQPAK